MAEEKKQLDPAVKECEEKYPEMTREFKIIMKEEYELFCKKQLGYGSSNITGGTLLETDEDVKFSLTGLFFRMNDKIQRIKQLVVLNKTDYVGESVTDTFQDLSIYGIISQLVHRKKWGQMGVKIN